jgi:hypothetical protein
MTIAETEVVGVVEEAPSRVEWGPVIAGAIAAAALAFVLHAFAAGIGIAVSSTAPTWRDASIALVLLSGLYLLHARRSRPMASGPMSPPGCAGVAPQRPRTDRSPTACMASWFGRWRRS